MRDQISYTRFESPPLMLLHVFIFIFFLFLYFYYGCSSWELFLWTSGVLLSWRAVQPSLSFVADEHFQQVSPNSPRLPSQQSWQAPGLHPVV